MHLQKNSSESQGCCFAFICFSFSFVCHFLIGHYACLSKNLHTLLSIKNWLLLYPSNEVEKEIPTHTQSNKFIQQFVQKHACFYMVLLLFVFVCFCSSLKLFVCTFLFICSLFFLYFITYIVFDSISCFCCNSILNAFSFYPFGHFKCQSKLSF